MVIVGSAVVVLANHFVPLQIPGQHIIEMIQMVVVEDVAWPGACTSNFIEIYFVIDTMIVLAPSLAS